MPCGGGGAIQFTASSLQTAESHQRENTCGLNLDTGPHSPCRFSSQRRQTPFLLLSSFSGLNCVLYKMFYVSSYLSVMWDKNNEPKMNQPPQRTKMIFFPSHSKTGLDEGEMWADIPETELRTTPIARSSCPLQA